MVGQLTINLLMNGLIIKVANNNPANGYGCFINMVAFGRMEAVKIL